MIHILLPVSIYIFVSFAIRLNYNDNLPVLINHPPGHNIINLRFTEAAGVVSCHPQPHRWLQTKIFANPSIIEFELRLTALSVASDLFNVYPSTRFVWRYVPPPPLSHSRNHLSSVSEPYHITIMLLEQCCYYY